MPTGLPSRVPRAAGGQGQHGEQTLRWAGRAEAATAHAEVALRRKRGPVQRTLGCPPCPGRAPPPPLRPDGPIRTWATAFPSGHLVPRGV